jgi:ATP-dependent RNA helicase DeaD
MDLPTGTEVSQKRIESFKELINDTLASQDLNFFYDLLGEFSNEYDKSAEDIASALAYLMQRERPLVVKDVPKPKRDRDRDQKRDGKKGDRQSRSDSDRGQAKKGRRQDPDIPMKKYRIEVGRDHEVKPGDIVGAIANEADVDSQYIGHIKLHDEYSTVDLPKGMPDEVFQQLRKVYVRSRPLLISACDDSYDSSEKRKGPKKHRGSKDKAGKSKIKKRPRKDK